MRVSPCLQTLEFVRRQQRRFRGRNKHLPGLFSNQLISRHLRSAVRARCRMTQRLFCEIARTSQICAVSIASTSRIVNASATRGGNFERHCLKIAQNSDRDIRFTLHHAPVVPFAHQSTFDFTYGSGRSIPITLPSPSSLIQTSVPV